MSVKPTKLFLSFGIALLLTAGLAAAEEAEATDTAPAGEEVALAEGGGCVMPDLAGLSDEEAEKALRDAGFGELPAGAAAAAAPSCPVQFSCSSLVNCGIGGPCSLSDLGPCCTVSSGLTRCCIQGTIKVRHCPCKCIAFPCDGFCLQSTDVQSSCS